VIEDGAGSHVVVGSLWNGEMTEDGWAVHRASTVVFALWSWEFSHLAADGWGHGPPAKPRPIRHTEGFGNEMRVVSWIQSADACSCFGDSSSEKKRGACGFVPAGICGITLTQQ